MVKKMLILGATLLLATGLAWASPDSWTGVVSDSHCGLKHSKASAAAATCVEKCVAGGGKYVLVSNKKLYQVETAVQTDTVLVEEKIDGSMVISHKGKQLKLREILARPEKATPRKRKYRGPKSGAKRLIIPIERLCGMMVLKLKAARQAGNHMLLKTGHFHFGRNRTFSLWLDINLLDFLLY